jgi:hypothetical protein
MKKNKKLLIWLMLVFPLIVTSCTDELAEMNIDPNTSQILTYNSQFLNVQGAIHGLGSWGTSFYGCAMQQFAAITLYQAPGDKYLNANDNLGNAYSYSYQYQIKNVVDLINRTKDDPELSNYYNIARIMKVYAFTFATDAWGDTPYFEAGRGFLDLTFFPVYDTQESIYMDFFKELNEAIPALDASKVTYDGSDSYYSGDIQKWKKLGYSLMLRLAMRIQKVKPDLAKQWVNTAISGGVFTSNADNQIFHHSSSGIQNALNSDFRYQFARYRGSKTLVDMLRNTGDPRLPIFFEPYSGTVLEGLPNGLDAVTIGDPVLNPTGLTFDEFAFPNRTILENLSAPDIGLNYSEVCFLKAEAVLRGWISGDATALYNAGVAASMTQWGIYDGITAPNAAAIQAYLDANPFDGSYEMIGNQMYLTFWRNTIEVFNNWRRTGYPVLSPINYPNNVTGGVIPRRVPYFGFGTTNTGVQQNLENYQAAVARQGPDNYLTRVWWDKE